MAQILKEFRLLSTCMPLATRGPEVHEESWQLVTAVQDTDVGPTFCDGHS